MFTSSGKEINIIHNFEAREININQAIPLGLLLNELITNSFKHAFEGRDIGNIHIDVTEQAGFITVDYQDDGVGFDIQKFEESNTLGLTLIKTLIDQLDAEFDIDATGKFHLRLQFQKNKKGAHSGL